MEDICVSIDGDEGIFIQIERNEDNLVSRYVYETRGDCFIVKMKHNYLFMSYFNSVKIAKTRRGFII